jgi:hypothetical protein
MLQPAQILATSPTEQRRTLHELRSRLGQAALTTAPDTRSLLEKRWAWLERQYASRPEVLGWLDTVFFPRFPGMGGVGPRAHKNNPLFCQALSWLARSAAKHGLPQRADLVREVIHEWFISEGYDRYTYLFDGNDIPTAIRHASDVAFLEHQHSGGQPFGSDLPHSWYRKRSHWWDENKNVDLSRFKVSWPYTPFQPGTHQGKAVEALQSRPVVTGKLSFGTSKEEEPTIHVKYPEALVDTFAFRGVMVLIHDPYYHIPKRVSAKAHNVPTKDDPEGDPTYKSWSAYDFLRITGREGVPELDRAPSKYQAGVRRLLDEVYQAFTVWIDEVAWICTPVRWFITEQLLDFLRAHPNYILGDRRIGDVVHEVLDWHLEGFLFSKTQAPKKIVAQEGTDVVTVVSFTDGAQIVEILTPTGLAWEGAHMHHCVGRDDVGHPRLLERGQVRIFSYRDPEGKPLATIEVENDSDTFPAWQTRDLQGPHNGPITTLEARVRLGTFLFELRERRLPSDDWKHAPLYFAIDELIDNRRIDKDEVLLHAWDLYWSASTVTVGGQYEDDDNAFSRKPLTIPKIPASLELRCADDRGRAAHPSDNFEDDKNCIEDYEQTVESYLKLNEDRTLPAVVDIIPSDDRDSRHTDCYLRFDLPDIAWVAEHVQAAGASGDALDIDREIFPFLKVWISETFGWSVT